MITATTVNDETFEGENFCDFCGVSINHETLLISICESCFCCYVAKLHKFSLYHKQGRIQGGS